MTTKNDAVEALKDETAKTPRTITIGDGDDALTLEIPRKFKRFKFMRALSAGDMGRALSAIWQPTIGEDGEPVDHPALEAMDDLELDDDEFNAAMEAIGRAVGGADTGNSGSSPTSS